MAIWRRGTGSSKRRRRTFGDGGTGGRGGIVAGTGALMGGVIVWARNRQRRASQTAFLQTVGDVAALQVRMRAVNQGAAAERVAAGLRHDVHRRSTDLGLAQASLAPESREDAVEAVVGAWGGTRKAAVAFGVVG